MTSPEPPEDVLRLDGLTVRYRRAIGCEDVSLRVPAGAVYGLLGRRGAGKSSIHRCILGQEKP
ncbi:MAG: ATP-binding cassette domain-containing protein, partial [Thermoanaerobaculia bacterium]